MMHRDILVFADGQLGKGEDDYNAANRYYAYTNYTLWKHGRLGAGVRIPCQPVLSRGFVISFPIHMGSTQVLNPQ
jgi:hypothetical protein